MKSTVKQTLVKEFPRSLFALGATLLVIAPLLLLYAFMNQSTLKTYQHDGVIVEANVIDKWKAYSPPASIEYTIKVGFFDKSILEGGELFMPTISESVYASTWTKLQPGDKVDVIYLPQDPKNTARLKDMLDPAHLPLIQRYVTSFVSLAMGIILVGLSRIWSR